jgi:SM-20-related protein
MSIHRIIDNVVPQEIFKLAVEEINKGIWTFNNNSFTTDVNTSFGTGDYTKKINLLIKKNEFSKSNVIFNLWNSINSKVKIEDNFKNTLKRVHLNCNPPLYDQTVHQDDTVTFSKDVTVVCFLHPTWNTSWGGEMLIYDEAMQRVTTGVIPFPNRAVVFPSYIPHRGVAVSRTCPIMRISIAFQCSFNNIL